MVFQRFALFPHRTVIGNVEYGLEIRGVPARERRERALQVLELVGLAGWENRRPDELSGGMQQRVGLARALAVDPDILLMDEAFSALDPLIKREMQDELLTLQSRMQKTIVFITHDLDEALKLGDRIAVLRDGRIEQIGTPEEIISRPASDYVAAFTAGVDRSKVLTASSVMMPPDPVIRPKDGPHAALQRMRRHGISSIFMVDNDGKLLGLVSASDARAAADRGESSLINVLNKDVSTVHEDDALPRCFRVWKWHLVAFSRRRRRGQTCAASSSRERSSPPCRTPPTAGTNSYNNLLGGTNMLPFELPIAGWVEGVVDFLLSHFQPAFRAGSTFVFTIVDFLTSVLLRFPLCS